jgi:hypothetical protein
MTPADSHPVSALGSLAETVDKSYGRYRSVSRV